MTIQELKAAYNEAYRRSDDLQAFCSDMMPKVFALLEELHDEKWENTEIGELAAACRPKPKPPKKQCPNRYTGGR